MNSYFKSDRKVFLRTSKIYEISYNGRLSYMNSSVVEGDIIAEPLSLTVSLRGTREVKDSYQIFRLTGLLDAFSEPTFRKVLLDYIADSPASVLLDLSKIDFLDSSGLGALVQLAKQAKNEKGTLQIVTNPRVTQTVKLVRLEKFLPLHTNLKEAEEAIAAFNSKKG